MSLIHSLIRITQNQLFPQGYDFKAESWFSWPSPPIPIGEQSCMLISNNTFVSFGGFRSPKSAQVIKSFKELSLLSKRCSDKLILDFSIFY